MDPVHVSGVIRNRREELGLTIADLANKAHVSASTVHRLESGNYRIRFDNMLVILDTLDLVPGNIITVDDTAVPVNPTQAESEIIQIFRQKDPLAVMQQVAELLAKRRP
ncbi:MAG: helix-turn-helix domain-containing protein [Candidatus Sumerlaeaceae bacterium]|nr:helix-turn-helix domain-containing protein [Candidatus Sumerlaeaceae bacterium]